MKETRSYASYTSLSPYKYTFLSSLHLLPIHGKNFKKQVCDLLGEIQMVWIILNSITDDCEGCALCPGLTYYLTLRPRDHFSYQSGQ